ncbi:MAG: esterase [Ruminiclostridium sp.]|nr:esterase [Ruminiclostridium sp.]
MAYITVKLSSEALNRQVTFEMFLPGDNRLPENEYRKRPTRTLLLLHGYTMSGWNWVPEWLAEKYNFAVVVPNGENSFWLDGLSTGHKYCTFISAELPDYLKKTFGLANDASDTCVMGLSMGGFGALHTALIRPERFGKAAALSSALIVHEVAGMEPGSDNGHANYEYYRECFGEPSKVLGSDADPEALADRLLKEGRKLPEIFMCCGTEDFLLENNREFHRFLTERGIAHEYTEGPGSHDFTFWNEYTPKLIGRMFG